MEDAESLEGTGPETRSGPETFLLSLDSDYTTRFGIKFRYYFLSHKHVPEDTSAERYVLRFSRGDESGVFKFGADAEHDFYGEGRAFDSLFQMKGRELGAKLRITVHAEYPDDPISEAFVDRERERLTPEGTATWRTSKRHGGYHLDYSDKKHRPLLHVVIGAETGEILYRGL